MATGRALQAGSRAQAGALLGKQRPGLGGLGTLLPRPRFTSHAAPLLAPQNPPFSESQPGSTATDGGHFMLRCGKSPHVCRGRATAECPAMALCKKALCVQPSSACP